MTVLRRLLLAALAAVALAALAASTAQAGYEHGCGDVITRPYFPDAPLDVHARNTTCTAAKKLAKRHYRLIGDGERCDLERPSCVIGHYTCRRAFFGDSGTRVTCVSGGRRVRFVYGV